jgi:hypothetical protein
MQLADTTAAANAKLNVTNVLSLRGTLTVNLANSFAPVAGNSFDILDWGTRSGVFSTVNLPTLNAASFGIVRSSIPPVRCRF